MTLGIFSLFSSCTRVQEEIEPRIDYAVQDQYLLRLPSPFPPLSSTERGTDWGKEYTIAKGFAKELDLYQTSTSCRRALFLLPKKEKERELELDFDILLCYYIGKRYEEAIYFFEHSSLRFLEAHHILNQDLLTILFDCYAKTENKLKSEQILTHMLSLYPQEARLLALSQALQTGDLPAVEAFAKQPDYPYLQGFLTDYDRLKKSPKTAKLLNAFLPGAGYLYLGQKQSAVTAFLLNGLFIGASCYFFLHDNIPAGVIFAGFEAGWYFGGITGAAQEAKFYNERIYEALASPLMNQERLFPILSLRYAF
ncbi:MAG: tetratricopeptide repeat protein [Chlamydiae bacterium]|nr:tetratricopeptide repeat protein [Chlamydiota bacterium]